MTSALLCLSSEDLLQTATHLYVYGVNFAQFNDNTATCYGTDADALLIDLPGMDSLIGSNIIDISNFPFFSVSLAPRAEQYNIGIATNDNKTLNPEPLSISYFVVLTETTTTVVNPDDTTPGSGSGSSMGSGSTGSGSGSTSGPSGTLTSSGLSTKSIVIIVVSIVAALVIAIILQRWLRRRLLALRASNLNSRKVGTPYIHDESPRTGSDITSLTPYSPPVNGTGHLFDGASGFDIHDGHFISMRDQVNIHNPILFVTSPNSRDNPS